MRASIITPTFNARGFVAACIDNVANQGDVVLEHIIADGGSTDGTVELIEELRRRHPHLRLLPGPDRGQSDAMNKATAAATGEVIGILNADDFYEPEAVKRGVATLAKVGQPALVCGDCRMLNKAGQTIQINRPKDLSPEAFLQNSWMFPLPINPAAYFYTRDVHGIVGGYDVDDSHAMDCGFLLTAAERVKMIYVPELWGNFRFIPGAKTFEDRSGASRVEALMRTHQALLTSEQWQRMHRARRWREWLLAIQNRLQRVGLNVSLLHQKQSDPSLMT